MESKEIVSVVNHLIERCKDGQKGFFTASEDVEDQDLKTIFRDYSVQRDKMITELQNELHQMGKTNDEHSSIEGTIHRAWIDIKSALTSKDRKRILEEAERGEDYAVAAFDKAMKADLPANLKNIVQKQYSEVKKAHDHIKQLRDSA